VTRVATLAGALAAVVLTAALVGCGNDDDVTGAKVDEIVAEYERLGGTDTEADEYRQSIQDALDTMPADEHDEYLDLLLDANRSGAEAVEEYKDLEEEIREDMGG
jgi:hypothetical protein